MSSTCLTDLQAFEITVAPGIPQQSRGRRWALLAISCALAGVVAACGGSSKPPSPTPSSPSPSASSLAGGCSTLLNGPTCLVLWGTSAQNGVSSLERTIGRRFDVVYFFDAIDSGNLPTADERQVVDSGQTLHINLESRQFDLPGHPAVRWSAVAAGDFDATLTSAAKGLASLRKPFFITFDHEADSKAKLAARGPPAQFVAAWLHVRKVFRQAGATQAIWTWIVTGYPPNFPTVAKLYPGNNAVDWISWDPYDSRGCENGEVGSTPGQTFAEIAKPFYDWLATTGVRAGISLKKPYMISETGSAYDPKDPRATAAFFASIPAGLRELPRIRAVTIWDQTAGDCNFRVDGISQLKPALRETASQLQHLAS
jgi:hypothetical protein